MTGYDPPAPRLAWWASFIATLALVAVLGVAKSAQALTIPAAGGAGRVTAPSSPSGEEAVAAGGEGEGEDGEEEEPEGCEEDEEEGEEDEEEECKPKGNGKGNGGPGAPRACLLSSAEAKVVVLATRNKVRLQVRYTTTSPTSVAVAYGLHGSKGSLDLGGGKKRFAGQGVLRLTRSLTEAQMTKVLAARGFTVRIRVLAASGNCPPKLVRQLTVKRATPGGLTWLQSG
jgi:hypothetical protein